jgi:hypothetical protein
VPVRNEGTAQVVHHRVPDGLDQDHPGQPNAPVRQAVSQLTQHELDVLHRRLSERDLADQPGQVPPAMIW